jgi:hypothetical protein
MRYQVPQFIEVEDKIFGPLTFKQFVYLVGAVGFTVLMFRILPSFIAFFISAPVLGLGVALAFYKVNNKPFVNILEAGFKYITGGKLYIWKKRDKEIKRRETKIESVYVPKMSESKLEDLSWGLDVKEGINGEEIENEKIQN